MFSIFILSSICCNNIFNNYLYTTTIRQSKNITLPIPLLIIDNQNEECSICLDTENISK